MMTIVYHTTVLNAKRHRRPKPNELVRYMSIRDFDEVLNDAFDNVEVLCAMPKKKVKKKDVV